MADDDSGFLSRWSRRKLQVRQAPATAELPPPETATAAAAVMPPAATVLAPAGPVAEDAGSIPPSPAAPTLAEAQALTPASDFRRFVTRGVTPEVRHAALKQLFADPHFNVMDGLDTYIDDYGIPDPLPEGMLRQMNQSKMLGLFAAEDAADAERDRLQAEAAAADRLGPGGDVSGRVDACADTPSPTPVPEPARAAAHEDPDLQLQPVDDVRQLDAAPGPGQDPGGQR